MPRRSIRVMGCILLMGAAGLTRPTEARAQRPDEPAMEAFRRQVRQQERRRQDLFDQIRRLPEPAPIPRVALPILAEPADDGERGEGEDDAPPRLTGVLAPENFDHAVFRDGAGAVGEASRRDQLGEMLEIKAERTARFHRLSPAEAEKLRLAGRGDVKHFFDRLAERRRAFDLARRDRAAGMEFLASLGDEKIAYREGPFGKGSLFEKALTRLLADRRRSAPRPG